MKLLYQLLRPFDTGDLDSIVYAEAEMRLHATHVIELLPPSTAFSTRGRDDHPEGLLAVLEHDDKLHVSFVVFRFASGHGYDQQGNVVQPPTWEPVFRGHGPSGCLRELRHTNWGRWGYEHPDRGQRGYVFYAPGPVITAAFRELARWFDGCVT